MSPSVATAMDATTSDAPNMSGTLILIIALSAPESSGGVPTSVIPKTHGDDSSNHGAPSNSNKVPEATTGTPLLATTVPAPGVPATRSLCTTPIPNHCKYLCHSTVTPGGTVPIVSLHPTPTKGPGKSFHSLVERCDHTD